jgi:hypothetical protein
MRFSQDLAGVVQKGFARRIASGFFSRTDFLSEAGSPSKGSDQQLYPCCALLAPSRRRLDVTSSPADADANRRLQILISTRTLAVV